MFLNARKVKTPFYNKLFIFKRSVQVSVSQYNIGMIETMLIS